MKMRPHKSRMNMRQVEIVDLDINPNNVPESEVAAQPIGPEPRIEVETACNCGIEIEDETAQVPNVPAPTVQEPIEKPIEDPYEIPGVCRSTVVAGSNKSS